MTAVDDLWFLATEASQQAEQLAHRLRERHSCHRGPCRGDHKNRRVDRRPRPGEVEDLCRHRSNGTA
jgi:hypothetical protein